MSTLIDKGLSSLLMQRLDRRPLDWWILRVSPEHFAEDLTLQRVDVHGFLLQRTTGEHFKLKKRPSEPRLAERPAGHLGDVGQQLQSLFEVVLVGSPVVVADVQLGRDGAECEQNPRQENLVTLSLNEFVLKNTR